MSEAKSGAASPSGTTVPGFRPAARGSSGLRTAPLAARLAELGYVTFTGPPAQFATHIARETEKWGKVLAFSGAKAE